jgi:beta-glucanase (GH16 family)
MHSSTDGDCVKPTAYLTTAMACAMGIATPLIAAPVGDTLVWSDEFGTDGLPDPTHWAYDTEANASGWYNHELQYYAPARVENAVVADGHLRITARHESLTNAADYGGQAYTSARLITRGLASWTYAYIEVRAKLPCGAGTWPAIWMLGEAGDWPRSGEIDIMEQVGADPTGIFSTVHMQASAGTSGDGGRLDVPDACTAFHIYALTWTRDALVMAVDGTPVHRYANPHTGPDAWPFDAPQDLLLNLAIGGDMAGAVDDTIFPVTFDIDYVRVYQTRD